MVNYQQEMNSKKSYRSIEENCQQYNELHQKENKRICYRKTSNGSQRELSCITYFIQPYEDAILELKETFDTLGFDIDIDIDVLTFMYADDRIFTSDREDILERVLL